MVTYFDILRLVMCTGSTPISSRSPLKLRRGVSFKTDWDAENFTGPLFSLEQVQFPTILSMHITKFKIYYLMQFLCKIIHCIY